MRCVEVKNKANPVPMQRDRFYVRPISKTKLCSNRGCSALCDQLAGCDPFAADHVKTRTDDDSYASLNRPGFREGQTLRG